MEPSPPATRRKRVLLVNLFANGDCLFATTVAWQIKVDEPDCHLTWAISSRCRQVVRNNPHVDEVWEIPMETRGDLSDDWAGVLQVLKDVEREVDVRMARGDFDEVYRTQIDIPRFEEYDGTIRTMILFPYPRPITVPLDLVMRLEAQEVENVARFAAAHPAMGRCAHVLLFECSPKSKQSFVTPALALEVSRALVARRADVCLLLSSNLSVATGHERIIDASALSYRENAELTKHCTLLVGCSSGITWLAQSGWAKPLPTVQLLDDRSFVPNSLMLDHERQGLPTDDILEMINCSAAQLVDCLGAVMDEGFPAARRRFHERLSLTAAYIHALRYMLDRKRYRAAWRFYLRNIRRDWPARGLILTPILVTTRFFLRPVRATVRRVFARRSPLKQA